jgi:tricarballylate dehydrogenase
MFYDAAVVGGGYAALMASVAAREDGASMIVLEHALRSMRGGNNCHTSWWL